MRDCEASESKEEKGALLKSSRQSNWEGLDAARPNSLNADDNFNKSAKMVAGAQFENKSDHPTLKVLMSGQERPCVRRWFEPLRLWFTWAVGGLSLNAEDCSVTRLQNHCMKK